MTDTDQDRPSISKLKAALIAANARRAAPTPPLPTTEIKDPAKNLIANMIAHMEEPAAATARSSHRVPGLHASSLSDVCARRTAYEYLVMHMAKEAGGAIPTVPADDQNAGNFMTQDLGHAMHHWWQNHYLGPAGLLWGTWVCVSCNSAPAPGFAPEKCRECSSTKFEFEEPKIHIKDGLDIHGHSDGVIVDSPRAVTATKRVFEFKSKSSSQFSQLTAPEHKHIVQVHAYMVGLDLDSAVIVYADRGKQCDWTVRDGRFKAGKLHIKSYNVKFDVALWADIAERVRNYHLVMALIKSIEAGTSPMRVLDPFLDPHDRAKLRPCQDSACSMAKSCAVAPLCFATGSVPVSARMITV